MSKSSMTRAEREAFLAQTHVGILTVEEPGRGPCATPVWYRYAPGGPLRVTLEATSHKAGLLRRTGRASLCAQTEGVPYRYVTVEGAIELRETDVTEDREEMAHRYLGAERAKLYLARTAGSGKEILLLLHPAHWRAVDFSKSAP
jgi:nitroimidazol reductase NimA-like FMN-containing flavoprotein (pyridoxamine 5'-phosphate oxidase superfamily)